MLCQPKIGPELHEGVVSAASLAAVLRCTAFRLCPGQRALVRSGVVLWTPLLDGVGVVIRRCERCHLTD
jgi:hypothetical protein